MKCNKCGAELRIVSEEYCKDVKGRAMYKEYAYCDFCRTKTPLGNNQFTTAGSQQIQNEANNNTNYKQLPRKILNAIRYTEIIIGILSLLGVIAGMSSAAQNEITGAIMIIFFGLISFLLFRKSNRDKFLDAKNIHMNTVLFDIQTKESELNNINSELNTLNDNAESMNTELKEKTEQIEEINNDIISKKAELNNLVKQISDFQIKLSKLENAELKEKTEQMQKLNNDIALKETKLDSLVKQISDFRAELSELEKTVITKETAATVNSLDYTSYDSYTSEECKNELSLIKQQEKELIKESAAVRFSSENSKKQNFDNGKQILRCFNAECDNIILSVSVKNIDTLRNKIVNSYESLNRIFAVDGIALTKEMLEFKLKELTLIHSYEQKRAEEREIQKAIKEQMLEEERVRKELEKRKQEIEKDQKQFNNEVTKLMKYLHKTENDIEKQLYADKIRELEERIKTLENEKADVINREQNAKAGFVYIISNIGSFGQDIYKIGMTRRLEPLDRIKELSSASVPFEFDVHAMIFSEDAPALESSLHQHFTDRRVNKVNSRKEFFKISIDEIEEFVDETFDKTVEFTKIPVAQEYYDSLALAE